jgi:hypothetical protein
MANYNFTMDLELGERFESAVCIHLNRGRKSDFIVKELDKKLRKYWDLKNQSSRWEIKLDTESHKTGNIFFELFSKTKKKSGMLSTYADYIVYGLFDGDYISAYQISYYDLMCFLFTNENVLKDKSGDFKSITGVLCRRNVFTNLPTVYKLFSIERWF